MRKFNITSLAVVLVAGALTAFLWLPLLPVIVPLVTLVIGLKRASALMDSEAHFKKGTVQQSKLLHFPITPTSNTSQASQPTAWSSLASLPSPARAGSLPLSKETTKNFKRQLRQSRQVARVMSGLDLRKSAPGF